MRSEIEAKPLDWFHPQQDLASIDIRPDLILAADVVWTTDLIPPLVDTLLACSQLSPHVTILLCHQQRSRLSDEMLFDLLDRHFSRTILDKVEMDPLFTSDKIDIFILKRKSGL